jgi:hypothetical protein
MKRSNYFVASAIGTATAFCAAPDISLGWRVAGAILTGVATYAGSDIGAAIAASVAHPLQKKLGLQNINDERAADKNYVSFMMRAHPLATAGYIVSVIAGTAGGGYGGYKLAHPFIVNDLTPTSAHGQNLSQSELPARPVTFSQTGNRVVAAVREGFLHLVPWLTPRAVAQAA